jgi:ATP phosphoribosyltransferase
MDKATRLKLAVQKSGRLTDHSLDILARCGLKLTRGKDQLIASGLNMPLDVLFVRDDDIPDLVQEDVCDLGLVGLNVLEERRLDLESRGKKADFQVLRALDFGRCRLSLAIPQGESWEGPQSLQGRRIATTYPATLARYLATHQVEAQIVTLSGAVEIAPRLGRADLICDLVSSGSTLQANHLREVEVVLESQVVMIRTPVKLPTVKEEWIARLLLRIDGGVQIQSVHLTLRVVFNGGRHHGSARHLGQFGWARLQKNILTHEHKLAFGLVGGGLSHIECHSEDMVWYFQPTHRRNRVLICVENHGGIATFG